MKATEQYFPVVLFIMLCKVILTFVSVDEILKCDHSDKSCWAKAFQRSSGLNILVGKFQIFSSLKLVVLRKIMPSKVWTTSRTMENASQPKTNYLTHSIRLNRQTRAGLNWIKNARHIKFLLQFHSSILVMITLTNRIAGIFQTSIGTEFERKHG